MKLINLAKRYNYICFWCKKKFKLEELSRDHIEPLNCKRVGGGGGNRQHGECVLACKVCNQNRGNLPFIMYKNIIKDRI